MTGKSSTAGPLNTPALRASIRDGTHHAFMVGAGESYLSAFAIFLHGTPLQVGTLATLPPLVGALAQNVAVGIVERLGKRRKFLSTAALLHAITWLPIASLPFLFPNSSTAVTALIGLVIIYHIAFGVGAPIWNSLIGDLVPPRLRGEFFGYRNKLCGMTTTLAIMFSGLVLDFGKNYDVLSLAYLFVFLLSFGARYRSSRYLNQYDDPPFHPTNESYFSLWDFLKRLPRSNFARFVLFVSSMNFAVQIAGPFFSLYMFRDLHFSYMQFMAISMANTFFQFITIHRWGALSDRFGNKKLMNVTAIGVGIVPIIWLLSTDFWIILFFHIYAGLMWAGFNLATANFLFDAVSAPKRARCSAYQALFNAVFTFLGSIVGGFLLEHLPPFAPMNRWLGIGQSAFPAIILMSMFLRLLVAGIFLRMFREVREVETVRHRDIIVQITHLRPMAGATFGFVTSFIRPRTSEALKPPEELRE